MEDASMERNDRVSGARVRTVDPPEEADEIRVRAYELFLKRSENGGDGSEFLDWVRAEAEVMTRRRKQQN